jgi:hypothetical protein
MKGNDVKTFFELTPEQRDQVRVQWSNWQPFDFYYHEGRAGMLISRVRISAGNLRHFVALHPAFGYQLYSADGNLVGVVRWTGETWTINGAEIGYTEVQQFVERWYRDGKEVLMWQCFCPDCLNTDAKRMGEYVGDAPITHGLCNAGGAKMMLEVQRDLDASWRTSEQWAAQPV